MAGSLTQKAAISKTEPTKRSHLSTTKYSDRKSKELAQEHYENFPVGSWLLPRRLRLHVHRLYAFARVADDIADEQQDLDALRAYRSELECAFAGKTAGVRPLLLAAAETAQQFDLEQQLFLDLLRAFERDLLQSRYKDLADLNSYCEQSANPVGRALLGIFGKTSPENLADSDRICTGLQILNHCQDLRADYLERGRVYLPQSMLSKHGVAESELGAQSASPGLRRVVQELALGVAADFSRSWPLVGRCGGRFGLELNAILHAAALVLRRLARGNYDSLAARPKLRRRDAPGLLLRALFQWRAPLLP